MQNNSEAWNLAAEFFITVRWNRPQMIMSAGETGFTSISLGLCSTRFCNSTLLSRRGFLSSVFLKWDTFLAWLPDHKQSTNQCFLSGIKEQFSLAAFFGVFFTSIRLLVKKIRLHFNKCDIPHRVRETHVTYTSRSDSPRLRLSKCNFHRQLFKLYKSPAVCCQNPKIFSHLTTSNQGKLSVYDWFAS